MAGVVAVQEAEWIVARIEGPRLLMSELNRVLGPNGIERDPDHELWRIAPSAWAAACDVFWKFNIPVAWKTEDRRDARPAPSEPSRPVATRQRTPASIQPQPEQPKEPVVSEALSNEVMQRVVEDQRATEREIESLRAQIAEREQRLEELRMFLAMYDHYSGVNASAPGGRSGGSAVRTR